MYPLNIKIIIIDRINKINKIEFFRPDLKDNKGNFAKCIGLIINIPRAETSINAVLGSP